jgi:hypothetical protein
MTDCQSGVCGTNGVCICGNGVQDGLETGPDCGGECGGCVGTTCASEADCAPVLVCAGSCTHCGNGVVDGDELGLDCGGLCPGCFNAACTDPAECASGECNDGLCGRSFCLEGWDLDPAGDVCTGCTQDDQCYCEDVLNCLLANRCSSPSACHDLCENTPGGGAAAATAQQVFDAMCS